MISPIDERELVDITECVSTDVKAFDLKDVHNRRDEEQATLLEEELVSYGGNDIRSENRKSELCRFRGENRVILGVSVLCSVVLIILLSVLLPTNKRNSAETSSPEKEKPNYVSLQIEMDETMNSTNMTTASSNETSQNETEIVDVFPHFPVSINTIVANDTEYNNEKDDEGQFDVDPNSRPSPPVSDYSDTSITDTDVIDSNYEFMNHNGDETTNAAQTLKETLTGTQNLSDVSGVMIVDVHTISNDDQIDQTDDPSPFPTTSVLRTVTPTIRQTSPPSTDKPTGPLRHTPTNLPTEKATEQQVIDEAIQESNFGRPQTVGSVELPPEKRKTYAPTNESTTRPTTRPTERPTMRPTAKQTDKPTVVQTSIPTAKPSAKPTIQAITRPTSDNTEAVTYGDDSDKESNQSGSPLVYEYHFFPTYAPTTTWSPTSTFAPTHLFGQFQADLDSQANSEATVSPNPTTTPLPTWQPTTPWPTSNPTTWLPTTTYAPTIEYPWLAQMRQQALEGRGDWRE